MAITLKLATEAKKEVRPPVIPKKEKQPFLQDDAPAAAAGAPVVVPPESVGKDRSILVVDDNPVVLKAFQLKLQANGFKVSTTSNAAEVASNAERAGAKLIILDVNFPASGGQEWSGFTIMQWLRRFPELATVPIIVISGEDPEKYKERALAEGAVAYFQKPVVYDEVLATILRALDGTK